MSGDVERRELIRRLRGGLQALRDDGVDFVPRPAAPSPPGSAQPVEPAHRVRGASARVAPVEVEEDGARADALRSVRTELGECTRCPLHRGRLNIVFGEGSSEAPVVFVGEGPGEQEDRTGRPFVGRAGELLTKIIEAVGWRRDDIYICNIVKCRPPKNRDPAPEEVAACRPFLDQQLRAIAPRIIVTLGKPAAQTLLGRRVAITRERGIWGEWNGIPLMPTYHPAYLLRNYTRETRQAVWDDLRAVRARVDEETS